MSFKGKTVLVTGGSMGIGYAIVKRFAQAGATVVVADISAAEEEKIAAVGAEYTTKTALIKTDVSEEKEVQHLVEQAQKKFGKIDVLVNNAGIYPTSPVLEMSLAQWEKTQAINLRGTFLLCREVAKSMMESGGGAIVNIASVDALHPSMVGLAAYDASKHGVWGFSKNFALEVCSKNIRVNVVAPGGVRTEGVEKMSGGAIKAAGSTPAPANVPMKRMGEPDEIATVTLFLASEAASYMTGSIVVVDGGQLLQ